MHDFKRSLTDFMNSLVDQGLVPGVDISVFHKGHEVYRYMTGYSNIEEKRTISEHTLYNLYSNTKVISCAAAMQLFERGLFRLDDNLSDFFPEFENAMVKTSEGEIKKAGNPIKILDLFRMTSGIGDGTGLEELGAAFFKETGGSCPAFKLAGYLAAAPLLFEPGSKFFYGISHELLAALIEKLTGLRFSEYLKKNIFEPLGMKNTAFALSECVSSDLATQYTYMGKDAPFRNEGAKNCLIPPFLRESASGGLISSVSDYQRFQESLTKENVLLHKRTTDLMRLNHLTPPQMQTYSYADIGLGYGLGVQTVVDQAKNTSPIGFGPYGWGGAAGTFGSIDPDNKITIFYAQSAFQTNTLRTNTTIRNIVYTGLLS
ncbi:MAG: beta-lactamase family protein [Clostridia bacterium]|nr:beta-lactamase family protein [Clostridia bacterium]MBQ4157838.1 beta-lactamase family protein [Clostridia bacterium]